jgi:hypothetical protein
MMISPLIENIPSFMLSLLDQFLCHSLTTKVVETSQTFTHIPLNAPLSTVMEEEVSPTASLASAGMTCEGQRPVPVELSEGALDIAEKPTWTRR